MKIIREFYSKINVNIINCLDLRSDIENENLGESNSLVNLSFRADGYIGNRPNENDSIEEFHEDDTWAIEVTANGVSVGTYLYVSELEYEQDLEALKEATKITYRIPITYQSVKYYEVEAENLESAVKSSLNKFFKEDVTENYIEDSFEIDGIIEDEYPNETFNINTILD